jgi:hypothetical protein
MLGLQLELAPWAQDSNLNKKVQEEIDGIKSPNK